MIVNQLYFIIYSYIIKPKNSAKSIHYQMTNRLENNSVIDQHVSLADVKKVIKIAKDINKTTSF